jgi:hypothetical protein
MRGQGLSNRRFFGDADPDRKGAARGLLPPIPAIVNTDRATVVTDRTVGAGSALSVDRWSPSRLFQQVAGTGDDQG